VGSKARVFDPAPAAARKPAPVALPPPSAATQSLLARLIAALVAAFRSK
jgi:hypothetical protein